MRRSVCLLLALHIVAAVNVRRGPHHPQGHEAVAQHHHHYTPKGKKPMTQENELIHDLQHLDEDSKVLTAEKIAQMTPEELDFHYFSSHDFDKNSKLDGLEMLKSVYHTDDAHAVPYEPQRHNHNVNLKDLHEFVEMVDRTLVMDDKNNDGYISYAEYRAARDKEVAVTPPPEAEKE